MGKNKKKTKIDKYIDSLHHIDGKTVIVTGANSGIGFEIAKTALIKGARVVMACRSLQRAELAKEQLISETGSDNISIEIYDQSEVKSIHSFSHIIKEKYSNFYALVMNAGIFLPEEIVDEYHISNVYRTNFLGAFLLLSDLKEFLDDSEVERRIIIQGSVASFIHRYNKKDKFIYGEDKPMKQYCLSKLCVSNLYAYYKNNNKNASIKYLLCEPGVAFTNLFRNFKKWFKKIAFPFLKYCCSSAREGSLSACKLMCDVVANGDYYHPRGLFTAKGLPKKGYFKDKYISEQIINDGREIMKIYEN